MQSSTAKYQSDRAAGALRLQVLISTIGERIAGIASRQYPQVEGIRYVVGWQQPDTSMPVPESLAARPDFSVHIFKTRGQGRNRHELLRHASAPIVLIGDDDVDYTAERLESLIRAFDENPDEDFLTFRFECAAAPRAYPQHSFSLDRQPKGYHTAAIETAVRLRAIRRGADFNVHFGASTFIAGEDTLFVADMLRLGLRGRYIPLTICRHDDASSGVRLLADPRFTQARGAIIMHLHPLTWPLRMLAHARRETKSPAAALSYCRHWVCGVVRAIRCRVFQKIKLSAYF